MAGTAVNALALINHANSLLEEAYPDSLPGVSNDQQQQPSSVLSVLSVDVHPDAVSFLRNLVHGELLRHRALVHLHNLRTAERKQAKEGPQRTLLESLDTYPAHVNLRNLVEFPPKPALIPVKPIFLDVAWNYIDYPGRTTNSSASPAVAETANANQEQQPKKKGWFGFGR
ncbi:hypothetical protein E4U53_000959 [Claviceps sorghi]|nr:hypothetical protein E4U53_000959 [Claviceps sorghi]